MPDGLLGAGSEGPSPEKWCSSYIPSGKGGEVGRPMPEGLQGVAGATGRS